MKKQVLAFVSIFLIVGNILQAQDTLPNFSAKNIGNNRILVEWVNRFENIRQISIQRSFDSLSGYKTILTLPDPTTPQNGYVDSKAPNDHMFYRIYILLEKGIFLFSPAKRPVLDTARRNGYKDAMTRIPGGNDSIAAPNFGMNSKGRPEVFTPSLHVYTYKDGSVRINLPDEENKKYSIKFFEEDDTPLFELKDVPENSFRLDKSNFYHAGWFKFELYENGKLIEKHRFYLQKDF